MDMRIQNLNLDSTTMDKIQPVQDNQNTSESNINKYNNTNKELKKEDLEFYVDKFNEVLKSSTYLKFEVHEKLDTIMIKIIDDKTKEVLKEVPPKKILDMVANLMELAGVVIDERR